MFNAEDKNGFTIGSEVVKYKGLNWLVVAEGDEYITIESDFSNDPNYGEYSAATMMFCCVDEVRKNEVEPFCSIVMKSGTDEQWNREYKKCGLMFDSCVYESCCE